MTQQQSTVYLSLGANIGERLLTLREAIKCLNNLEGVHVCSASSVYETEPLGLTDQPKFLNIAVEIETALAPLELLNAVKALEKRLGRVPDVRWGPRVIDIDVILWGAVMMRTTELTIPHEHFRSRRFVLTPLAEIAPDVVDPETGSTVAALLRGLAPQAVTQCAGVIHS